MTRAGKCSLAAAVAVAVVATGAFAQAVRTQDGRLLDRSPQVGSGGINSAAGSNRGVNAQLYVRGITGGRTAMLQTGQLLDRNRQLGSGGYNRVLGGRGGVNTELFVNRQRTGTQIFRGQIPYSRLQTMKTLGADSGYATSLTRAIRRGAVDNASLQALYAQYANYMPKTVRMPRLTEAMPSLAKPGMAVVPSEAPREETEPTSPLDLAGDEQRQLKAEMGQLRLDGRTDARIDAHADFRVDVPKADAAKGSSDRLAAARDSKDVLVQIVLTMERIRKQQAGKARVPPEPDASAVAKAIEDQLTGRRPTVEAMPDGVVVRGLVNVVAGVHDRYMDRGQRLLKEGKYYLASGSFELAVEAQPTDPLARVGWGLSLFAAGEPLSAADRFREVLEVFPPLMETRFDFTEMMERETLLKRMIKLDRRVNQAKYPDRLLVFLSTYLHFNLRREVDAKYYARKLGQCAGDDEVLSGYAKFILARRGAGPAMQPAK